MHLGGGSISPGCGVRSGLNPDTTPIIFGPSLGSLRGMWSAAMGPPENPGLLWPSKYATVTWFLKTKAETIAAFTNGRGYPLLRSYWVLFHVNGNPTKATSCPTTIPDEECSTRWRGAICWPSVMAATSGLPGWWYIPVTGNCFHFSSCRMSMGLSVSATTCLAVMRYSRPSASMAKAVPRDMPCRMRKVFWRMFVVGIKVATPSVVKRTAWRDFAAS